MNCIPSTALARFERNLALFVLDLIGPEELSELGLAILLEGSDSSAAAELAGLSQPTSAEAAPPFLALARELKLEIPSLDRAVMTAAGRVACAVVSGAVEPRLGAEKIASIHAAAESQDLTLAMSLLADEFSWDRPRTPELIETDILKEAARLCDACEPNPESTSSPRQGVGGG